MAGKISYNPTTHEVTFQGRMTSEELQMLSHLQVFVVDPASDPLNPRPLPDEFGNPLTEFVALVDSASAQTLFTASQDVPLNPDTGYLIAGPGRLNVNARNLDLGATLGIQSVGPARNHALAQLGASGADINVNLGGTLDMFSTTISSSAGGDIAIKAQGDVNVGSATFVGNDTRARGIFTVAKSDVSVLAKGDINVNGSRIAAYDGGSITIISEEGKVDAGKGGNGSVTVEKVYVDPVTGEVKTYMPTIPGSGVLATSFPPSLDPSFPNSPNTVGNITVKTPKGDIIASSGGIVQVALNGVNAPDAFVTLVAGSKDAQGNVLYNGSIDATGSGIIGGNVNLDATDGIKGLVVAQQNININAQQNVSVTAIGAGNVNVSAGGTISGTIVGVGSVNASGSSVDAALLSQNVNTSGNVSGQVGFGQANAAGATSQSAASQSDEAAKKVADNSSSNDEEEKKKKQLAAQSIRLARSVGRVTVILSK
jgi:hypothetical protein